MTLIRDVLCIALTIYYIVLLIRILLSWVPALPEPIEPLARGVRAVTDPVLTPLRGVLPPVQMGAMALDLSPLVLFFAIVLLQRLFC